MAETIILKYPITRTQFAGIYNLSPGTFSCWLRDIKIEHRRKLSPQDIKIIVEAYGVPIGYKVEI